MEAEKILREMTLEEKLQLCCGGDFWKTTALPRLGVLPLVMSDGPHGLRYQKDSGSLSGINDSAPATCFPTASLLACSWDRDLVARMAAAIAQEAACAGVDVILGPGINIKRNPLCGRNFEYYSEDPYLAGQLGAAFARSAQKAGAGVCLKHFAANSQEYKRFSSDSIVDERAMREIYLAAFEAAIREGDPAFVMCAYNKLNGVYCSDNKKLLTDILRDEWGFSGAVVTDWGAMHDRVEGFRAGCDLSMPGGSVHHQRHAADAVRSGKLDESFVDASVIQLLRQIDAAQKRKQDHGDARMSEATCEENRKQCHTAEDISRNMFEAHHRLAKRAALKSAVLLKNDGVLPLRTQKVCLVGAMAGHPRYQGAGSSHVNPTRLSSLAEAAAEWTFVPGCDDRGGTDEKLLAEARQAAAKADAAVVVVGLPDSYESEGYDREHMRLPEGHNRMVEAVAEANPNTVVVLMCGSPVELPWYEKVRAILYLGLSGQAGCEAAVDLLTGKDVPCGKLAETWPLRYEDTVSSSYYGKPYKDAQYRESIYVGYRYYETADVPIRFPFGFGLSYTTFAYRDLNIDGAEVSLTVKNMGNYAGEEIVQLYIAPQERVADRIYRPAVELRGFEKVFLQPGEEKTVGFTLNRRCFAIWQDGWKVPAGSYEIRIGSSVRDIRLKKTIEVNGDPLSSLCGDGRYISFDGIPGQEEFEKLLGRKISGKRKPKRGEFDMESTIAEMAETSLFVRVVKRVMERVIAKMYHTRPGDDDPQYRMSVSCAVDCALFTAVNNAGRMFPEHLAYALLDVSNGRFLKAVFRALKILK